MAFFGPWWRSRLLSVLGVAALCLRAPVGCGLADGGKDRVAAGFAEEIGYYWRTAEFVNRARIIFSLGPHGLAGETQQKHQA